MSQNTYILGISAYYHDSAAALVRDGEIVAAAQEERFTRKKHDFNFPDNAVQYCLEEAGIGPGDLDLVAFYDKPMIKFERILESYLSYAPLGIRSFLKAMPLWIKQKLWIKDLIHKKLDNFGGKILFPEHHESHAASAFYPSPFDEAAFLTVDGVGEWTTTSYGVGRGSEVKILGELMFPHSLGMLYSAFTYFTGFKVNSGEYKLMGLAPYGEPRYVDVILDKLIDLKEDGSFKLDMRYFNYCVGLTMTNRRFGELFGGGPRRPETKLTQREMDLASSIQVVTEEIMMKMTKHVREETGLDRLVLAGGCALNCVSNGRILREGPFSEIWIQPAAGDAGGALGAALLSWYDYLGNKRDSGGTRDKQRDRQKASYLGPAFGDDEIESFLESKDAPYEKLSDGEIPGRVAALIADENVIGWFQGRMEFGPRALGARSILGDARSPEMQTKMNLKIKFRESFRPFAPTVLEDHVSEYFELDRESPYMLLVANVREDRLIELSDEDRKLGGIDLRKAVRSTVPAITHVDNSARVQSVARVDNPLYYDMIESFRKLTDCAVIINTSFNVRGEPIVCTPEDAFTCFMRTNMDYLVLGSYLLDKKQQAKLEEDIDWRQEFELD